MCTPSHHSSHSHTLTLSHPYILTLSQERNIEFIPTIVLAGTESDSINFKYNSTQTFTSTTVALNSTFSVTDVSHILCMQHISTFVATIAFWPKVKPACCLGGVILSATFPRRYLRHSHRDIGCPPGFNLSNDSYQCECETRVEVLLCDLAEEFVLLDVSLENFMCTHTC